MNDTATPGTTALPPGVEPGGRFDAWRPGPVAYVVCDVDGTLVGPEELASEEVVTAIARVQEAGLRVGYATGRMRDGVASLHRQLGASGPHVLHNGAEVRADGTTIAAWSLRPDQVDALLAIAAEHDDLYLEVYAESGFRVSAWDERARAHWRILGVEPLGVITSAADLEAPAVPKATFVTFSDDAARWLLDRLRELDVEVGQAGSPLTPGMSFVNASRSGATKGAALRRAAEHLGIGLDRVAAIGDAPNDLSMLEVAGTAIAMGQAPPEVRAAAHLVVPEVGQHGVATALDALREWSTAT